MEDWTKHISWRERDDRYEKLLAGGIWCVTTVNYFYEEGKRESPFSIGELKPIQMPNMDMDGLFEGRKAFTESQWIDVLMRSTGMEPAYLDQRVKRRAPILSLARPRVGRRVSS